MPYCWNCGSELDEDARFCPTCGTPVAPPVTEPERRRIGREERRPISAPAIVAIVLVVSAAIVVTLAFSPLMPRTVDINEPRDVSVKVTTGGVNSLGAM